MSTEFNMFNSLLTATMEVAVINATCTHVAMTLWNCHLLSLVEKLMIRHPYQGIVLYIQLELSRTMQLIY